MFRMNSHRQKSKKPEYETNFPQSIEHLLRDNSIGIQYDEKSGAYTFQGFQLYLYHHPLRAKVERKLLPGKNGRVTYVDGVSWTAYAGRNIDTIPVGSSVLVIGRYGNTLLVKPVV